MTVSPVVGRALKSQNPERVHLIEIGDFTLEELRNYLQCRHRDWGRIPQDVRKVLRRPLLAKLYCELDPSWTPKNEYALFERYWQRIQTEGDQADSLQDTERMRKLAVKILQQDARYPWDLAVLEEVGITEGVVKRLESIGWLRIVSHNQFEIWHDRLLSWAVAEALVVQRQAGRITLECSHYSARGLPGLCKEICGQVPGICTYGCLVVSHDPSRGLLADVPHLIAALENHQTYGGYPESLYRDLLPTLGERVIPALIERLRTTSAQKFSGHGQLVSTALVRVGNETPEEVRACVVKILNDPLPELQRTGMRVLARVPCIGFDSALGIT